MRGRREVGPYRVRLIDTPGIEEVGDSTRGPIAIEAARRADVVLFVAAEDLTATARSALVDLRMAGKPMLVAVNKMDLLDPDERAEVLRAGPRSARRGRAAARTSSACRPRR